MGRAGGRGGGGGSRGGSFGGSRGGSFGGGRSSSSRSSSSFGSSRSSSSFGRSGSSFGTSSHRTYSSPNRPRTTGSFWGMPRTTGPIIINNSGNNNQRNYTPNNSGNNNNTNRNNVQQNNGGCLHVILIIVMIASILVLLFNCMSLATAKRVERTPLSSGAVIETDYYTDELGWINNSSKLEKGLEYFYKKTGVQPYVYITDDVGGDFYDYAEKFADNKYDQLFKDEGHVLLVFWEQDYYATYCLSGSAADTVIDSDARNIILDKLDEYYWDSSLDEDEYFSKAFEEAADDIMRKSSSGVGAIVVPLFVFIAALATELAVRKKEKEAKREKELKEMLDKPLETFGSTEAADLAKKYEDAEKETEKTTEPPTATTVQPPVSTPVPQPPVDTDTAICHNCGVTVSSDHIFCSNCGTKLK